MGVKGSLDLLQHQIQDFKIQQRSSFTTLVLGDGT